MWVAQPLFTPSPFEGLAVHRAASYKVPHTQECLCYRTPRSEPKQPAIEAPK